MLLMIDNYDSFTYNLVHYFNELGVEVSVFFNDQITLAQIIKLKPQHIVISPGPGNPTQAGISLAVIQTLATSMPILGVCLGHQAIAQALGAQIVRAERIMHGKTSSIQHCATGLFSGIPQNFCATRYHSLVVAPETVPACLEITAWTHESNTQYEIMGLQHHTLPLHGVQFHPESILSEHGHALLQNFLKL